MQRPFTPYSAKQQPNLEAMRIREGSLLIEEIGERITVLHDITAKIEPLTTDHAARWREKIIERLKSVLDVDMLDSSRLVAGSCSHGR